MLPNRMVMVTAASSEPKLSKITSEIKLYDRIIGVS